MAQGKLCAASASQLELLIGNKIKVEVVAEVFAR